MSSKQSDWLKGNFPTWIVAILLSMIGWGFKRAFDHFDATITKTVDQLQQHELRISILELKEEKDRNNKRAEFGLKEQ